MAMAMPATSWNSVKALVINSMGTPESWVENAIVPACTGLAPRYIRKKAN